MKDQLVKHTDKIYDGTNKCLYITVHETANPAPGADAQAHADLQSGDGARNASWHATVDDKEAIRSYPDTAQCWHAGADEGNKHSLAVEICVNEGGDYDAAFRRAAIEVVRPWRIKHKLSRSDVKQHFAWTGKNCPTQMRLAGRWEEFLDLTEPNQTVKDVKPVAGMVSPFEGRLTQNHGDSGGYRGHKGMDIAPPRPGQVGMPVYAAFDGTIRRIARGVRRGNLRSTWAPRRTGGGMLVSNPDGEGNGYNHIRVADKWQVGEKVRRGDLLGHNDYSGNQTAPHLHLEFWADWQNPDSDYDPQDAFTKFKIKPGSRPVIDVQPVGNVTPAKPKPKPKPAPSKNKSTPGDTNIQNALTRMGIDVGHPDGVNGPKQKAGVKVFQRAHGLVDDGVWGPRTKAVYLLNKKIQQALKKQGYTRQGVDGYYGDQTETNVRDFQRRTGLKPDGIAGSITQKRLGI